LSLDIVRARIFYLACDVETVSPPAAMLLRAVADAIDEGGPGALRMEQPSGQVASFFAAHHLGVVKPVPENKA
jgi:hypothetical protein